MKCRGYLSRPVRAAATVAVGLTLLVGTAITAPALPVYYQVRSANWGSDCLQIDLWPEGDRGAVYMEGCNRSASQVWQIAGGVFRNPATGHCLDGNGTFVYTYPCNNGAYQKWTTTSGTKKYIRHNWSGHYLYTGAHADSDVLFDVNGRASRFMIEQL